MFVIIEYGHALAGQMIEIREIVSITGQQIRAAQGRYAGHFVVVLLHVLGRLRGRNGIDGFFFFRVAFHAAHHIQAAGKTDEANRAQAREDRHIALSGTKIAGGDGFVGINTCFDLIAPISDLCHIRLEQIVQRARLAGGVEDTGHARIGAGCLGRSARVRVSLRLGHYGRGKYR